MDSNSAVEYWEKYSVVAFDQNHRSFSMSSVSFNQSQSQSQSHSNVSNFNRIPTCCGVFTIKRDVYEIPLLVIGNFLPRWRSSSSSSIVNFTS